MNLIEKITSYWHVPTACMAFQKYLLSQRELSLPNNLDVWKETLLSLESLAPDEQQLLQTIMLRIDPAQTDFTLEQFYALIKDVSKSYYKERFVLLKYTQFVTYEDSWNDFYRYARGVVIDLDQLEVATASLKKFYNVDERVETSLGVILQKMEKGRVVQYVKQDGSNVNVSYQNELLITTPGSFFSNQVNWANTFLQTYHADFLTDLATKHTHLTFVFEYVGPENRVVVYYPKTDMILLQIVDKTTGDILPYETMRQFATTYHFTPCDVVDLSFEQLLADKDNASLYKSDEQEGWVIRIDDQDGSFLVKLKCSDYVNMHRMIANALNPKWIYEAIVTETFDDKFAALEGEEIKVIVTKIAELFFAWGKERKARFETILQSIPEEQWIDEEMLDTYHRFLTEVNERTASLEKKDRVKRFLEQFSKGKTSDPKEEIMLKARSLYEMNLLDLTKLAAFDQYKSMIGNHVKSFSQAFKQAVNAYVFEGVVDETFAPILTEHFQGLYAIEEGVNDLAVWKETFAKDKGSFYRLASSKKENLAPSYYNIQAYAKKKIEAEKKREEIHSFYRKEAYNFFFRASQDPFITSYFDNSLIIDDTWYAFYLEKQQFEQETLPSLFPNEKGDTYNQIISEYYLMARGFDSDDSYARAKELFEQLDPSICNQQAFYAQRGKFSAYINQHIQKDYVPFVFEFADKKKADRLQALQTFDFLPVAQIVLERESDQLSEFDIDFRNIQQLTNQLAIQDN